MAGRTAVTIKSGRHSRQAARRSGTIRAGSTRPNASRPPQSGWADRGSVARSGSISANASKIVIPAGKNGKPRRSIVGRAGSAAAKAISCPAPASAWARGTRGWM